MVQQTRKDPRAKVLSMTVRYRSATLGEFIEHHSYDVSRGGMFIKTPSPFPAGTLLKFEVKIADEQRVMQGVGRVVWKREHAGGPEEPAGMGIKFIKIDEASRSVIERLLESRGPGKDGAFERSPETEAPMFPPSGPLPDVAPEDRTVLKPASELLDDALRRAGEPEGVPPAEAGPSGQGFSAVLEPPRALSAPPEAVASASSAADGVPARTPSRPGSVPQEAAPRGVSVAAAPVRRAAEVEEEGGAARTFGLLLLVAGVAVAIFLWTKSGEREQAGATSPAALPPPPSLSEEPIGVAPLPPAASADAPDASGSDASAAPFEPSPAALPAPSGSASPASSAQSSAVEGATAPRAPATTRRRALPATSPSAASSGDAPSPTTPAAAAAPASGAAPAPSGAPPAASAPVTAPAASSAPAPAPAPTTAPAPTAPAPASPAPAAPAPTTNPY
jgi:uncharacterized protein (TIGR02266 family)